MATKKAKLVVPTEEPHTQLEKAITPKEQPRSEIGHGTGLECVCTNCRNIPAIKPNQIIR